MDIKSLVKEARNAIKNKNFQESMTLCRKILKEDPNNYLALIFLGFSIQETNPSEEIEKVFRKAIEINPDNLLAWNGLANYFEKLDTTEARLELIKIYTFLIGNETVEKKMIEYCDKLCSLYKYTNVEEICKVIHDKVENGNYSEAVLTNSRTSLVNILQQSNDLSDDILGVYENILNSLISNDETVSTDFYAQYLMVLYKQKKIENLIAHAIKMYQMYPDEVISMNWICKLHNEFYVEKKPLLISELVDIKNVYTKLLNLEPENAMGIFTRAVCEVEEDDYEKAKESMNYVVSMRAGLIHAWILLAQIHIKLHSYKDAINAAEFSLKLLKSPKSTCDSSVRFEVEKMLLEALSRSSQKSDWITAIEYYESLEDESKILCLTHFTRANIKLGNMVDAVKSLTKLEERKNDKDSSSIILTSQYLRKEKKFGKALEHLEKEKIESAEWFLELGVTYLEMKEFDKSLYPLLKAVKMDTNNCYCFYYLGLCYKELKELDTSRRCLEKSFKLNSNFSDAAMELSRLYRILNKMDANMNLLLTLTENSITKHNMWAWLQLGQILMEQDKNEEAVNYLRKVITLDPNNSHCWETLADAYLAKGSYTSALKAYEKVLEISGDALYPTLQIATIKKDLGYFDEAILYFNTLLRENKKCLLTLTGLAETFLLKAKKYYQEQRLGTSRDYAQYCVECLTCVIQQSSKFSCVWKIFGDCLMLVAQLPEKYSYLMIKKALEDDKPVDGEEILIKTDLFQFAAKCYGKALILAKENDLIWYDLAVCYLRKAEFIDDKEISKDLLIKAEAILQHCTTINPTYWQHWNLLGNVALALDPPNLALAQHAFIKAVQVDNNCFVAWTNLGVLYTMIDNVTLANQAFGQAQRSNPEYAQSWIGQGLLAEKLAQDDEAMDLFRHSNSLNFHPQSALGYGHWVCRKLLESPQNVSLYVIKDLHAIPVACDALIWYIEKYPENCCAWNMLGILKERMNLVNGAAEAFETSLNLSDDKYGDLVRINYARTLVRLGHYKEAIEICSDVKESSFNSGIWYALALYKDNKFQEASSIYLAIAQHLVKDKYSFGDVVACMAIITYVLGAPELAKKTIVESFTQRMPTARVMYALIALGVLQKDAALVNLTLKQVEILEDVPQSVEDFIMLLSHVHIYQGNYTKALRKTTSLVHLLPNKSGLWLALALTLLQSMKNLKSGTLSSINKAAHVALQLSENESNIFISKIHCVLSVSYMLMGDWKSARISSQKAVFCTPNAKECWIVLNDSLGRDNNCKSVEKIVDPSCTDFEQIRSNRIF